MARLDQDFPQIKLGKAGGIGLLILVGLGVFVVALFASIKIVPTGHVGVLRLYGTEVTGEFLPEGIRLANPFKSTQSMSIQDQTLTESAALLSQDGLNITLDTSLVYRLQPESAPGVLKDIGLSFESKRIIPAMRAAVRNVGASYSSDALYTGDTREQVRTEILDRITVDLATLGFEVRDVLLRGVKLPPSLMQSIEAKQQADQEAQRMRFVLARETQEAERKRIEAGGIRDFQRIVAQGLSSQYLTWKGIEATEKLAGSTNAKVVVIGSGRGGLPIILGGQ